MYNNHRSELHLMASSRRVRDSWTTGIQHLIDRHAQKSQRHFIKEEKYVGRNSLDSKIPGFALI